MERKKISYKAAWIIAVCVAVFLLIFCVVVTSDEFEQKRSYNYACALLDTGEYKEAAVMFGQMRDYRDAEALWYYALSADSMQNYTPDSDKYWAADVYLSTHPIVHYNGEYKDEIDALRAELSRYDKPKPPPAQTVSKQTEPQKTVPSKTYSNTAYDEEDEYNVNDYGDEEEFYEENRDEFDSFEDAEDYYYEMRE